jgi:peptide/nickel transport system permease protein
MSTKITTDHREFVIPPASKYNSSIFAYVMSLFTLVGMIFVLVAFFYGVLYLFLGILETRQYFDLRAQAIDAYQEKVEAWIDDPNNNAEPGPFRFNALTERHGQIILIDPMKAIRTSVFLFLGGIILYYIIKKIYSTYGFKELIISEMGITIKSIGLSRVPNKSFALTMKPKTEIPWEAILDIVVKKSSSLFSTLSSQHKSMVIYTMDNAYNIEGVTLNKQHELADRLNMFGDSLEERVIDFGYGAALSILWRRMKRSRVGMFGISLVVFFTLIAVVSAAMMTVYPFNSMQNRDQEWTMFNINYQYGFRNPNYTQGIYKNTPPGEQFWFGTDDLGRDMFSRIFFGSFYSILIGFIATIITVALGAIIGATSGYLGGTVDNIVMRIADVLLVLPGLPILILISATFTPLFVAFPIEGAYYIVVFTIFSFIGWAGTARYARSEVLALKHSEFIQAEYILGATHWRIISKHIIPNTLSTIIIIFTLGVAGTIQAVASLAFLGFGSQSTLVWGDDLARASGDPAFVFQNVWWPLTFVSLALFLLTLGFNLMGDSFRDALDPKLKE